MDGIGMAYTRYSIYAVTHKNLKSKIKPPTRTRPWATGHHKPLWDHTVLPATRHKWTHPTLTPASKPVPYLPAPEGWKAGWPRLPGNATAWVKLATSRSQYQCPNHYTTEPPTHKAQKVWLYLRYFTGTQWYNYKGEYLSNGASDPLHV